MKTGVIDVGGGLRGIYGAGVFDCCMDAGIAFDLCIGISAGSANVTSYLAGQKGRNYPFYMDYPFRREYMSLRNLAEKKEYLDLDYIYGTLSDTGGENPLDYERFAASPAGLRIVATDAQTGRPRYFGREDIRRDQYDVLKASSAIPVVCHPVAIGGHLYYDGALSDPIPLESAFSLGCDKVVVILTKPRDYIRTSTKDDLLADRIWHTYPAAARGLRLRASRYNRGVAMAKDYEKEGSVLLVAPSDTCGLDTLKRDRRALRRFYEMGLADGEMIRTFLAEEDTK